MFPEIDGIFDKSVFVDMLLTVVVYLLIERSLKKPHQGAKWFIEVYQVAQPVILS
ncbi:hypothetical protein (plasmid) [Salmonella enterica subsp. enterica serovar Typhi str. CT18]|uniref:Uncharacterized protein n=1 Tax=Salmonella typhi TaxID=90370 RepID=Q935C5_SALTI|nr:hypothetical protein [Salmonella enterica subsp. enterica serovar Typhi str. CT18]